MSEDNLKSKTKKSLYWQFFNQFGNTGLQFVITTILARLLTPEDYGITALPVIFLAVSQCIVESGFGAALIRKPDLNEKDLSTAFYYGVCMGIILYLGLFLASPFIADFYDAPILTSVLKVTALGLLLSPVASVLSVQLTRSLEFKVLAKISLTCRITTGFVALVIAFSGYGIWALVVPQVVGSFLNIFLLYYCVRWRPKEHWSKESFKYLWGFGSKLLFSYLLGTIYENIYVVVIGKFYSPVQLGIWNRAQSYANLPSKQATGVLQSVTFPVLSKIQDDEEKLAFNYRRILRVSAFVVFPIMLLLSALAEQFVVILITDKWIECVPFLQIMCVAMMLYPIHAINLNVLQVKGRSDLFLRLEIIKKIMGVAILCVTIPWGLIPMAWGMMVSSILSFFVNTYYTGKLIHVNCWRQTLDIAPIFGMAGLMYFVTGFISSCFANVYVQVVIGGAVAVVLYLGIAVLLKREELNDLKYMLKRKS